MKRRIAVLVAIAAIVGLGFILLSQGGNESKTPAKVKSGIVQLDNAADFAAWLPNDGLTTVEQTLYKRVKSYVVSPLGIYHGTIRGNSLTTTYNRYQDEASVIQVPTVHYIVDIPEARQSYAVHKSGGEDYPYDILYVKCLPADQLKYGEFGCVDEY